MPKFTKISDFMGHPSLVDMTGSPSNEPLMKAKKTKGGDWDRRSHFGNMPPHLQDWGEQSGVIGPSPLHGDIGSLRNRPMLDPEEVARRRREWGSIQKGGRFPGGTLLEIDDPKKKEGYDLDRAQLGFLPEGSDEIQYGTIEELLNTETITPEDVQTLYDAWKSGHAAYLESAERTRENWNRALKELDTKAFGMLKTNFLTGYGLFHEALRERIDERMANIVGMEQNINASLQSREQSIEEQAALAEQIESILKNDPPSDEQEYLRLVSMLYMGDIKQMSENVLGIDYPPTMKEFFDVAASMKADPSPRPQRVWQDVFDKNAPPINDPNMAGKVETLEHIKDIDKFKGPASVSSWGEKTPAIMAQSYPILRSFTKEQETLSRMAGASDELYKVITALESKTLDASRSDHVINKVMPHLTSLLNGMADMYVSTFVNEGEEGVTKLDARFSVGSESKMSIFLLIKNMAGAFETWYNAITGESILEHAGYKRQASKSNNSLMKIASVAERKGLHILADMLLDLIK